MYHKVFILMSKKYLSLGEGIVYLMVPSCAGTIQKKRKICAGINGKYLWGDCLFNGPQLCGDDSKKRKFCAGTTNELIYSFLNRYHCIGINTLQIQDKYFDALS